MTVAVGGSALAALRASAQPAAALSETYPQAAALAYMANGGKVDQAKYP